MPARAAPRARCFAAAAFVVALLAPATLAAEDLKPTRATQVGKGLAMPVDFAFGPDGAIYYVELFGGGVRKMDPTTGAVDPTPLATVTGFNRGGERGVFGFAVDPEFATTRAFYVSYSRNTTADDTGTENVLSRFVDGKETVLLVRHGDTMHNGGRILFADGYIFLTTGDATSWDGWDEARSKRAQDPAWDAGKVLRVTKDGAPAPGNPWGTLAWSVGHRNLYGIAYDPATKRLWVTENGNERADEINLVEKGANYGWPTCAGPCTPARSDVREAILVYEQTIAPTGATVFRGDLWFSDYNRGQVHRAREANGTWTDDVAYTFKGSPPRVLDLEASPEGDALWFSTWDGLWRLDFDGPPPPTPPPTGERLGGPSEGTPTTGGSPTQGSLVPTVGLLSVALALALSAATARRRRR